MRRPSPRAKPLGEDALDPCGQRPAWHQRHRRRRPLPARETESAPGTASPSRRPATGGVPSALVGVHVHGRGRCWCDPQEREPSPVPEGAPPSWEQPRDTPWAPRLSGDTRKLGGRFLPLRPLSPVLEAAPGVGATALGAEMIGDRASSGAAAGGHSWRPPQLFALGSQPPSAPEETEAQGRPLSPGGWQGLLEPPPQPREPGRPAQRGWRTSAHVLRRTTRAAPAVPAP